MNNEQSPQASVATGDQENTESRDTKPELPGKMVQFNLNDYVLIQITEEGFRALERKYARHTAFVDICIRDKREVIDGKEYYRLQAHSVMQYFGDIIGTYNPGHISTNILVPSKSVSTLLAGRMQERDEALDTASSMLKRVREEVRDREAERDKAVEMLDAAVENCQYLTQAVQARDKEIERLREALTSIAELECYTDVSYEFEAVCAGVIAKNALRPRAEQHNITDNQTDKT
jgi:hypothetical protein